MLSRDNITQCSVRAILSPDGVARGIKDIVTAERWDWCLAKARRIKDVPVTTLSNASPMTVTGAQPANVWSLRPMNTDRQSGRVIVIIDPQTSQVRVYIWQRD